MATPFTESEALNGPGATKRKRKRRRSPGGLGRGLARILTESNVIADGPSSVDSGLLQLVGGESSAKATKVRKFVVDTALAALSDAFELDGVILATHSGQTPARPGGEPTADDQARTAPTFLAATLPPSWSLDSQILFEVYGNLWRVLKDDRTRGTDEPDADIDVESDGGKDTSRSRPSASEVISRQWCSVIDRHQVWMARMDDGVQPIAVVAIRSEPFSPPEAQALAAVIGSVVDACTETEAKLMARQSIRAGTSVSLKSEGADVLAEVSAEWEPDGSSSASNQAAGASLSRRTGVGRAGDTVSAVARGAAKACRPRCEITFAGASDLDDNQVSVVMIRDAKRGLRLGFAVRPHGDYSGAAEAVFTAAAGSQSG